MAAGAYPIAEGELEINADPSAALRNVQEFLRQVDRRLLRAEDDAADSGRRAGRRFGDGLHDGFRGSLGGSNMINNLILGGGGGGEGEGGGGGGGGGFIQGILGGLSGGFRRILDEIRDLVADIQSILSGLGGGGGFLSDLRDAFNDLISWVRSGVVSVLHYLHATWIRTLGLLSGPALTGLWTRFLTWVRLVWSRFNAWAGAAFGGLWTRIRSFGSSMLTAARVIWTRFTTWAIASWRLISTLASSFWARARAWARYHWTTFSVIGRWVWGQVTSWARGAWTRIRGWASSLWGSMSARGRSIWTRFAGWARTAITTIGGWFSSLFTWISSAASTVWTQLSSVFSSLSGVAGQLGPILQIAMYAALVPIILALGGAIANLLPLLLLLPAAIGTLAAIIAPAIVGFKGLGEAIGAGLSGDVDKLNESLKKLTPNAQKFVKEFIKLGPALKDIKKQTQQALFAPLLGTVAPLAKTLLPALAKGMATSAAALGRLLAGFAKMLGTPEVISAINALFASTARVLDKLGPPIASLFGALFGTVEGGLPWIERLTDVVAGAIQKFADWLRLIKGDGSMQRWLETAWSTAKDFWNVLVQLGLVIKNLFADSGDEGQTFLQDMAASLQKLNQWLSSKEGKEALDDLVGTIVAVSVAIDYLAWTIGFLGSAWLATKEVSQAAWRGMKAAWNWMTGAFSTAWAWLKNAGSVSWAWVKDVGIAIGQFFVDIGDWFVDAYDTVVGWGGAILDWFSKIPGWIGQFFSNLPGWIADGLAALRDALFYGIGWVVGSIVEIIFKIPGWLASAWEWIRSSTVAGASALWSEVSSWPGKAGDALSSLGSTVLGFFDRAWDSAYEATSRWLQSAWQEVSSWPGRVGSALSSLPGKVSSWFNDTWTRARDSTTKGVDDTVGTVSKIPGRIGSALSGAGRWLYDVGRDAIRGLVNGIEGMLGWAVDQARRAANAIKDGFLDGFDIGSPSRVMQHEVGHWLLPGVMKGVDDTIPDAQRYMGAVANMMVEGFRPTVNVAAPNVSMGSTTLSVDLGHGIRQVVPLEIQRNPRIVAAANSVGTRERTGWVNTGRGRVPV